MQFLTMTYNHEKYIIQHLESVRYLVVEYSEEPCSLLIFDDASSDKTVDYAARWIEEHRELFEYAEVVTSETNCGVVSNYLRMLSRVQDSHFKCLAGDDLYGPENIFSLWHSSSHDLIETPVLYFDDGVTPFTSIKKRSNYCYRYLIKASTLRAARKKLRSGESFAAPGVFISKSIARDAGLNSYLRHWRNIEDLPEWHYLINCQEKDVDYVCVLYPYILYRVGSGISTSSLHSKNAEFLNEEIELRKIACPNQKTGLTAVVKQLYDRVCKALLIPYILIDSKRKNSRNREYLDCAKRADSHLLRIRKNADKWLSNIDLKS